ncbi:MAG: GNAT family N-acetyltransferase [Lunatimonas sp.]|uniref:GNAT family N-acetyltransferase n=1 Tax=Lunatimonas sp. TaxID=2060141 RepID=UPI00263AC15A|nr:GNAT family N-acetyltransferase [Lunatimonas sp.]MCC5937313.1 GNAT family N-acetyltransferase [Lunatimonas sp.]
MYTIRKGEKSDIPAVFELIKELALYEKAPEQVTNSIAMMEEDGFGKHPVYGFFVAEKADTGKIIGTAIYYYRYSTWKGRRLYLEDYIVTESERGKGAGKLLFEKVMQQCMEDNCTGMMWQVLDWNEPAINFYKKYDSEFDEGWINCHLQAADIQKMLDNM